MAYYDRYKNVKRAGIGLLALLLLTGGYFLFFGDKGVDFDEIKDLRVEQIELYEKLLETDPYNTDTLVKLGNLYKDIGDIDKAIEYYKRALEIDPNNYSALNSWAMPTPSRGTMRMPSRRWSLPRRPFPNTRRLTISLATCSTRR